MVDSVIDYPLSSKGFDEKQKSTKHSAMNSEYKEDLVDKVQERRYKKKVDLFDERTKKKPYPVSIKAISDKIGSQQRQIGSNTAQSRGQRDGF